MTQLDAARVLHQAGNLSAAEPAYRQIIAAEPGNAEAHFLLGMLAIQTDRVDEGTASLRRAITAAPNHAKAHNALGVACHAQGRMAGAIAAFRTALAIAPDFTEAAHNLARILAATDQKAEAELLLRQIVDRLPGHAAVHSDLGSLYNATQRGQAAEVAFRRALALAPGLPEAARNLAALIKAEGRDQDARELLSQTGDGIARFMLATTNPAILSSASDIPGIEAAYLAALDAAPGAEVANPLTAFAALGHFYFAYYDRPLRAIHEATASSYRRLCPPLSYTAPHCRNARPKRSRPRVAFISANFHAHTISRLFAGLVTGLAEVFEVIAVAAPGPADQATERLSRAVPFVRLPADLFRARQVVADLEADMVVYLDIGMEPFTYFLAHARLAPLQLVTFGHPVTPGLDTIDGFLSAEYLDPPGAEDDYTEPLYRLPAPAFYFDRPEFQRRDRAHFNFPARARLYVCPQTLFKLHPDFDALMAEILRNDSAGRVVLLAGDVPARKAALERRFARTMPEQAERVIFLPALPRADFLGLLGTADVMLDIPSFSGGNSTLEGLAAGLPVITLPSRHLRGRFTAGLLRLAGLDQGIAQDAADYCHRAIKVAADGAAYRAAIADQAGALYQRRQAVTDLATALENLMSR